MSIKIYVFATKGFFGISDTEKPMDVCTFRWENESVAYMLDKATKLSQVLDCEIDYNGER